MMVAAQALLILSSITAAGDTQLLYFGASWCEPCHQMQPVVARLSQDGYAVRKLDVDTNKELAQQFQVSAVPSFVLVNPSGQVIDRIDQATTYEHLRRMLAFYQVEPTVIRGQSPKSAIPPSQPIGEKPRLQADIPGVTPATKTPDPQVAEPDPATSNAEAMALAASVRLKVEDATGYSFGTGTVVDVQGNEALVLTCAHIFRESKGKGAILIDRYDATVAQPTTGSLISHDLDLDVALVSMKVDRPIAAARLAGPRYRASPSDHVFSVGCNHGKPPTVARGRINQINKYLGPANITASGTPVDGRSGGGLFNSAGELIGVCNAADPEWNEGLYAALPRVHQELDRNGLSFVYQPLKPETRGHDPRPAPQLLANSSVEATPLMATDSRVSQVSHQTPVQPVSATTTGAANELVCVLQSTEGEGKAFVIKNPSSVLLDYLRREAAKSR